MCGCVCGGVCVCVCVVCVILTLNLMGKRRLSEKVVIVHGKPGLRIRIPDPQSIKTNPDPST